MKGCNFLKLMVVTVLLSGVFAPVGDSLAAKRGKQGANPPAEAPQNQGIHGNNGFGMYAGVGLNFGGAASRHTGAGVFSVFGRFGLHKFFNEQAKKPTFYLAGDVFLNLGLFSIVDSSSYFMPVIGFNVKPGVAFGNNKAYQAYGIVGISSVFLASSPFQGFLLFDLGGGIKYDVTRRVALFSEMKISPTMVAYGSLGGYAGGDPVFITFNIGADFKF